MSIWDDIEEFEDESNVYLGESDKSIELIAKILKYDNTPQIKELQKKLGQLDILLDKDLLFSLKSVDLTEELKLYNKVLDFSDKLREQNRLVLLKNKVVVGVGGMFSAGKSCFINSILGEQILPEDQDATTSIPTYVLKGEERRNFAYTYNNQKVDLDNEAVNAISHAFKRKFGIGFAGYISNIVIQVDKFPYSNISLLDTPGYSKDDSGVLEEMTDAFRAKEQLRAIDYLIWLVDVENGVIQQKDIDFIKNLRVNTPILVVMNKASKKTKENVRDIVGKAKESLKHADVPYFDVIAYDSLEGTEYLNNNGLRRFMDMVDGSDKIHEDIKKELDEIINQILSELKKKRLDCIEQVQKVQKTIVLSRDILEIQSFVDMFANLQDDIRNAEESINSVYRVRKQIGKIMEYIGL